MTPKRRFRDQKLLVRPYFPHNLQFSSISILLSAFAAVSSTLGSATLNIPVSGVITGAAAAIPTLVAVLEVVVYTTVGNATLNVAVFGVEASAAAMCRTRVGFFHVPWWPLPPMVSLSGVEVGLGARCNSRIFD